MLKKLAIISVSALLLGGCTLGDVFKTGDAARDEKSMAVATSTPAPAKPDQELEVIPSVSTSTDTSSLEADINNTKVLEEDFSDIEK
jgi:hypothetical protein